MQLLLRQYVKISSGPGHIEPRTFKGIGNLDHIESSPCVQDIYFILSSEINAYQKRIKVISIISKMI